MAPLRRAQASCCVLGTFLAAVLVLLLSSSLMGTIPLPDLRVGCPSTAYQLSLRKRLDERARPRLAAFVGIQTGFTPPGAEDRYNYRLRREALRSTWIPGDKASGAPALEFQVAGGSRHSGEVLHRTENDEMEAVIAAEAAKFDDILRLNISEAYTQLPQKTVAYFSTITESFDATYIFKVDDDVFMRLDRLPAVIKQWTGLNADYIGCMKTGEIFTDPDQRWYEPQHALLGSRSYFPHVYGSCYVLGGEMAATLSRLPPDALRLFNNEDVMMGSWMLALNSTHYDDRRMCEPSCTPTSVAVYQEECSGLCSPLESLPTLWQDEKCRTPDVEPDMVPPTWDFSQSRI